MGIVVVDVCDGNLMATIDIERIIESKYPEVAVLISDCLTYCGLCRIRPYVLVNGKRIIGRSIEECLENIYEAIEKELAIYE